MVRVTKSLIVSSVAALALTACGGGGGETADTESGGGAGSTDVTVTGTDGLAWSDTELAAEPGQITVALTCGESVPHTFVIEDGDTLVAECQAGATGTGAVELEAGEYVFYCDVPGHREAGMEGTLTVG